MTRERKIQFIAIAACELSRSIGGTYDGGAPSHHVALRAFRDEVAKILATPPKDADLLCRLNRLERREAEARELLSLARAASQTIAHKAEWAKHNGAWLSEEGV